MHTSTVEGGLKTLSFSNSSLLAVFSHKKYICSILPSHEIVRNGPASHLKVNGRVMAGIKTHVDGENGAFEETAEAGEFHSRLMVRRRHICHMMHHIFNRRLKSYWRVRESPRFRQNLIQVYGPITPPGVCINFKRIHAGTQGDWEGQQRKLELEF